jgi:hypothetical protein
MYRTLRESHALDKVVRIFQALYSCSVAVAVADLIINDGTLFAV